MVSVVFVVVLSSTLLLVSDIPVTNTYTFTSHSPYIPEPSLAVALILASPASWTVTSPVSESTVTAFPFTTLQVTSLFVVSLELSLLLMFHWSLLWYLILVNFYL